MSGSLALARDLDRRLEESIAAINLRLRTLDEQMAIADELIAEMGPEVPIPSGEGQSVFSDSSSEYEYQNIDSSDEEGDDQMTVAYTTGDDNRYFSDEDESIAGDDETIVGDWEDPYVTPHRGDYGIVIPMNLEFGLEFLG
jgi:hypothetical protein